MTYATYLNIKKPFDKKAERKQMLEEDFKMSDQKWGNGSPLSDNGRLIAEAMDLQEFG